MRKTIYLLPVLLGLLFSSCLKDKNTMTYTIMVPVYKDKAEVYANIKSNPARGISSPGKIFLYGNYIFLNEVDKGVHVIDNTNPANPVVKTFIDIPGNLDIAVKDNMLYADLYSDLVVVDIADPLNARFVRFLPQVFPHRIYSNGFMSDSSRIIVDWIRKDTTVPIGSRRRWGFADVYVLSNSGAGGQGLSATGNPAGIAGSMSRFALVNDFLYTVNMSQLRSYNITDRSNPSYTSARNLGWNIETIYPFRNKLFVGSATGMFIFSLGNPASPVQEGTFSHVRSCDPVIANDTHAFVTLRNGTVCSGTSNQLDVLNVTNISSPQLIRTYPLTNPHGLSKDNNQLFICDGAGGLKLFDATDPGNLVLKKTIEGIETYDAIAWNNNLLVVAKDGLYQFDYSTPFTLVQKSKLGITK